MTNEKEYYPQIAMSIHAHPDDQDAREWTLQNGPKRDVKSSRSSSPAVTLVRMMSPRVRIIKASWRVCAKPSNWQPTKRLASSRQFFCTTRTANWNPRLPCE